MKKLTTGSFLAAIVLVFTYPAIWTPIYAATAAPLGKTQASAPSGQENSSTQAEAGGALFLQNCAFCHGRDAEGGETGPDLTRSKLVAQDVAGSTIDTVVRNGRPDKGIDRKSTL